MLSVTLDHVFKLSKRFYSHIVIVIVKGIKKLYFLLVSKILQEKKYKEISTKREVLSTTLTIVTRSPAFVWVLLWEMRSFFSNMQYYFKDKLCILLFLVFEIRHSRRKAKTKSLLASTLEFPWLNGKHLLVSADIWPFDNAAITCRRMIGRFIEFKELSYASNRQRFGQSAWRSLFVQ